MPPWKPEPADGRLPRRARAHRSQTFRRIQRLGGAGRAAKATRAICRRCPRGGDGWQLGTARSRRHAWPAVHAARRRRRCLPHLRDCRFRSPPPRYVGRWSSGPATRAACITRTSASIARDRPGGSMRRSRAGLRRRHGARRALSAKGSCSGGRPASSRARRPTACRGGSSRAAISSSQLHLQPTGKPEPVQVSVGFFFTDTPPVRTPVGLRLGSETIDIPAGRGGVRDRRPLHAAGRCRGARRAAARAQSRAPDGADGALPDGTDRPLITIRDWDFRWQDVYRYATPFVLPKGTTICDAFHL